MQINEHKIYKKIISGVLNMFKSFDLRRKKVIDIKTAEQVGYIRDMDIDLESGKINSVTVPHGGICGMFRKRERMTVPWKNVLAIGSEYVIVRFPDDNMPLAK